MLLSERWEDPLAPTRSAMERLQSRIWTMLPCHVVGVDASGQTVTVQPTVSGMVKVQNPSTGFYTWEQQNLPQLPLVPIKYPSGGGWTLTFPIKAGDEGTVHFSSRCIDNWWVGGGVQPPLQSNGVGSLRMHDLSDGFFVLGGKSQPNYLNPVPSTSSVQFRDNAGQNIISFDANNGFSITMPGGVMTLDKNGNLYVSGNIIAGYNGTDQVGVQTHKHSGVQTGSGDSGPPLLNT